MQIVIDISEEDYKNVSRIVDMGLGTNVDEAIKNGTPLDSDSERAETQAYFAGEAYGWEQGRKALIDDVKAEIDEQYDRIRPYNIDVAEGLEMAHGILDNIGKEESEDI